MPSPLVSVEGTVLLKELTGESWLRLIVLTPDQGILTCLKRASAKQSTTPAADLFDELGLELEAAKQGSSWFVRELRVLRRRPGLAQRYETLLHACRFARILGANPLHEESRLSAYRLLQQALDSWENGGRPEIIAFKSLYVLARDEGYPVREDWFPRLAPADRAAATELLNQPVAAQTCPETLASALLSQLEHYLEHHTEIHLPA